jgi:hypothetical protein
MNSIAFFTDMSLNPELKFGVGAYLVVPTLFLKVSPHSIEISELAERLVVRRFVDKKVRRALNLWMGEFEIKSKRN